MKETPRRRITVTSSLNENSMDTLGGGERRRYYVRPHSFLQATAGFRGRFLGRNPDKSLKSFPPCYSQSPLQLCLEIYISSYSRNLLQFL
jgi:hypothetical protein